MVNTEIARRTEISYEEASIIIAETLGDNILTRSDIFALRLPKGMHLSDNDEWHGEDHGVKVLGFGYVNARLELARERQLGLIDQATQDEDLIDFLGFSLALMGHDCGRHKNHPEAEHGEIGAGRFELFYKNKIPDASLDEAIYLIRRHVPPDDPSNMTRAEQYLKNADALDRLRTLDPVWTLNTDFLRDESARLLVSIARKTNQVYQEIKPHYSDRFIAAVEALVSVGLVR